MCFDFKMDFKHVEGIGKPKSFHHQDQQFTERFRIVVLGGILKAEKVNKVEEAGDAGP